MAVKKNIDDNSLQFVKGVGPKRAEALIKEGFLTPIDMLFYFPRAYVDRSNVASIKSLSVQLNQYSAFDQEWSKSAQIFKSEVTLTARIIGKNEVEYGKKKKMLKLQISDGSGGNAFIIFWNFAAFYSKVYKIGDLISVSGRPEVDSFGKINFNHPEIEKFDEEDMELYEGGAILPIYKLSENMKSSGINTRTLRNIIKNIIEKEINNLDETLPDYYLAENNLLGVKDAVSNLHFPQNYDIINRAKYRFKLEEILLFEIYTEIKRQGNKITDKGYIFNPKSKLARKLYDALPFELTRDQKKVINEITNDMKSGSAMNRLLQGDVGSGKTIVSLLCMLVAVDNGSQVVMMAPTEILAEQHLHSLNNYLKDFNLRIVQLVGGQRKKLRQEILGQIESGEADIIVGTHAVFESEVHYKKLGFIVIDEQHRFGVEQRAELKNLGTKSNDDSIVPHILVMSATPIPRTLSLTLYGDLDVSVIKQLPKDRKPIKTKIAFESQLDSIYNFIREQIKAGKQAYVVYPLVEKSEKLELKAAIDNFENLRDNIFPDLKCGLLHGQMFWYEKEEAMTKFLNKEYDILVATTVIEVGIDVPNATLMVINEAQRFGLSQLHQLRGRVGRGSEQSFCILVTKDHFKFEFNKKGKSEEEQKTAVIRLKAMEHTCDGFEIANIDLKLRGPGDVMGTRQSGVPTFKHLDLVGDIEIIEKAKNQAKNIISIDAQLRNPENVKFRKAVVKSFYNNSNFFDIA